MHVRTKIETKDRPKLIAAIALTALAVLLTAHWIFGSGSSASAATSSGTGATAAAHSGGKKQGRQRDSLDPTLHSARLELSENERYEGSGRNIFQSYSDQPVDRKSTTIEPEPKPSPRRDPPAAPTIRIKFFGLATVSHSERKACFARDGNLFIGGDGDVIDGRYEIVRIGTNTVDLEDRIENRAHTLTLER